MDKTQGVWAWRRWARARAGTKQGWCSPVKPVCSQVFTALPPSQPGCIAPPPEFPKAFQPPAPLPSQDKEKAEDKDNRVGGTHQGVGPGLQWRPKVSFGRKVWRAFATKATPDLLLLLLLPLCCSGPARPVTTNANRVTRNVCSPEAALLKSRCVLKLVAARKAWLTRRKRVHWPAKRETSAQDGRVFSTGF